MSTDNLPHTAADNPSPHPDLADAACTLCEQPGGTLIWRNDRMRVVLVDEPNLPGYTRVIWHRHVREMSDLSPECQHEIMRTVFCIEAVQRTVLQAEKVNLASLGNMTPHLHWHVIPRWEADPWYPDSIWTDSAIAHHQRGETWRTRAQARAQALPVYLAALEPALRRLP